MGGFSLNTFSGLTLGVLFVVLINFNWVNGNTKKIVEIFPSSKELLNSASSLIVPKPRMKIPSDFARNYWVPGNFFNDDNFQGTF